MDIQQRSLKHIWYPCSQMKDYEQFPPIPVKSAQGSYLTVENDQRLIDATSSWWCKNLGHQHPRLKSALLKQLDQFEHVILANTTNETIVELSEMLADLTDHLDKITFASDGSCAVEIAIKMSLQARRLQGQHKKQKIMALKNAYHGETILTMAVSDLGLYRQHYEALLPDAQFIEEVPYVTSRHDPLWNDCGDIWQQTKTQLDKAAEQLTAIIVEPLLQGTAGMLLYSKDFLQKLAAWCQANDVHLIADEILTGLGRTGYPLACQFANIKPDFVCIAKGLTAGVIPMSVCMTTNAIYDLFYDDYETGKAFMHSHTHSGNALAAAVAVETLKILQQENIYQHVQAMEPVLLQHMQDIADSTGKLKNVRGIGACVAADLICDANQRLGYAVSKQAIKLGALLRPLGNTLYWFPPLNTDNETLLELKEITGLAIEKTDL